MSFVIPAIHLLWCQDVWDRSKCENTVVAAVNTDEGLLQVVSVHAQCSDFAVNMIQKQHESKIHTGNNLSDCKICTLYRASLHVIQQLVTAAQHGGVVVIVCDG